MQVGDLLRSFKLLVYKQEGGLEEVWQLLYGVYI